MTHDKNCTLNMVKAHVNVLEQNMQTQRIQITMKNTPLISYFLSLLWKNKQQNNFKAKDTEGSK